MDFAQNWADPRKLQIDFGVYVRQQPLPLSSWRSAAPPPWAILPCTPCFWLEWHTFHSQGSAHALQTCTLLCQGFHHAPCGHGQLLLHRHAGCKHWGNPTVLAILAAGTFLLPYWRHRKVAYIDTSHPGLQTWLRHVCQGGALSDETPCLGRVYWKLLPPEISCNVSSTVGTGCLPRRIARFACLIFEQMRMSPLGFSTATSGLIQPVGALTFSTTFSSPNCF